MIKIAYFNDGPLLPVKEGGAERIINLIRFENIYDTSEVVLFECERPWTNTELLSKEDFKSVILNEKVFYSDIQTLNSILEDLGIQACIFTNPENLLNIGSKLKNFGYKIIYDCHNVYSEFSKRIKEVKEKQDLISFMEFTVGQIADLVLPCSQIDLNYLGNLGVPKENMLVVENGVNTKTINFVGPNLKLNTILFLGNIYYQPNLNAVKDLYQYCYKSHLLKSFKFIIVGSAPENVIKQFESSNFKFLGYIPDLNDIFKESTIAVAPLKEGSGTRLKILNYLAAGIPTIATDIGIEGLDLTNKEIIIENDIKNYPYIISEMFSQEKYKKVVLKGRSKVENEYDWEIIGKKAINYYKNLFKNENYETQYGRMLSGS